MVSCSSINDLNVSNIIEKTENWFFQKDSETDAETVNSSENQDGEFIDEAVLVEEVYPDINEVPMNKPEFDQIDEDFFESEGKVVDDEEANSDIDSLESRENEIVIKDNLLKKNNIAAILEVRQNIRLKLTKLFLDSDPPVDQEVAITNNTPINKNMTKVAIIQFPENAVIPDSSADKVLDEIVKYKDTKKLRLVGHASKTGSDTIKGKRRNMEISISRAETIKNILVNKGFNVNNIEALGRGDLEPLQEEAEKFGEAINRRVEVFFISN